MGNPAKKKAREKKLKSKLNYWRNNRAADAPSSTHMMTATAKKAYELKRGNKKNGIDEAIKRVEEQIAEERAHMESE